MSSKFFNILEANNEAKNPRISVHHASEVIGMDEHPGQALRKKKRCIYRGGYRR